MEVSKRVRNIRSYIDQFIVGYKTDPAKGLVHGFQKDAIQNSWGHRKNAKNGKDWELVFRLVNNRHGNFLIVEDNGCTGLIGHNYSQSELEEKMKVGEFLGENEKLARFSTLNNSGGNTTSAGTYGRGKQMYQAVSKELKYLFDSYTVNNDYYANYVDDSENTFVKSLENEKAYEYIYKNTGLGKKEKTGTRIIICEPLDEIVSSIKSLKILDYIEETWWRVILKYDATIRIYNNDELIGEASVPEFYNKAMRSVNYKEYENIQINENYKIKKMGIGYIEEKSDSNLMNIAYYRRGMKIGNVYNVSEELPIDEKFRKNIWGFIEFQDGSDLEEDLRDNEDLQHYGPMTKAKKCFQVLKKTVKDRLISFLEEKSLIKKDEFQDPNKNLNDLADDLADFLRDSDFDLKWESEFNVKKEKPLKLFIEKTYPNTPLRTLEFNQSFKFKLQISSKSNFKKYKLTIVLSNGSESKNIVDQYISFEKKYSSDLIALSYNDFFKKSRNLITIKIVENNNVANNSKIYFPVYVDVDDSKEIDDFSMLYNYNLPNENSLSVYNDQLISDLNVSIMNNSLYDGLFNLRVLTQDVQDRNNTISEEFNKTNIEIKANDSRVVTIGNIIFGEKYYKRKGLIRVKFILSHIGGINGFEYGEKIIQTFFTLILNSEQEDITTTLPFEITQGVTKNKYAKSELINGEKKKYQLVFNQKNSMWKEVAENPGSFLYRIYVLEEVFRRLLKIQFENGECSAIGIDAEKVGDYTVYEISQKIDNVVNEFLGKYFEVR